MKVLNTSVPIFTSDFEAAIERYQALTGESVYSRVRTYHRIGGSARPTPP